MAQPPPSRGESPHVPAWALYPVPAEAPAPPGSDYVVNATYSGLHDGCRTARGASLLDPKADPTDPAYLAAVGTRVWDEIEHVWRTVGAAGTMTYLQLASIALTRRGATSILRRFARHPSGQVREAVRRLAELLKIDDQLPARRNGDPDAGGWFVAAHRPAAGALPRPRPPVPTLATIGELRQLLKIPNPGILGFMLLASAARPAPLPGSQPGAAAAAITAKKTGPYYVHTIPKRDGSPRTICAPVLVLKRVQRRILDEILSCVPVHPAAHGFVPGRSIATNALPHVGRAVVLKFDLKDFFPSVSYHRARGLFSSLGYPGTGTKFSNDDKSVAVAQVLARLCCYCDNPKEWGGGFTPQGSPASPALANLVCRRLDARLSGVANKIGAAYTRYADDLTFSFADSDAPIGKMRWWVDQVCQQEGFIVNVPKFRCLRNGGRQIVTGVVVNSAPRAPKEVRRWLRAVIHNVRKNGLEAESRKFAELEGAETDFVGHVRGLAAYLHMVSPGTPGDLLAEALAATDLGAGANPAPSTEPEHP